MMIKKVNFFQGKEAIAGLYENISCEECGNPLDLRFSSEGIVKCSSCGKMNILKKLNQEKENDSQ